MAHPGVVGMRLGSEDEEGEARVDEDRGRQPENHKPQTLPPGQDPGPAQACRPEAGEPGMSGGAEDTRGVRAIDEMITEILAEGETERGGTAIHQGIDRLVEVAARPD